MYFNILPKDINISLFLYFEPEDLCKYVKDDKFQNIFDNIFWKNKIKLYDDEKIEYNYQGYLEYLSWKYIYLPDSLHVDDFSETCYGLVRRKNWKLLEELLNEKPKGDKEVGQITLYILLWQKKIEYLLKLYEMEKFKFRAFQLFEALLDLEIKDDKLYYNKINISCLINKREICLLKKVITIYQNKLLEKRINWNILDLEKRVLYLRGTFLSDSQDYLEYFIDLDCKFYRGLTIDEFLILCGIEEAKSKNINKDSLSYEYFMSCKYY